MSDANQALARQGAGALARTLRRQLEFGLSGYADDGAVARAIDALEQALATSGPSQVAQATAAPAPHTQTGPPRRERPAADERPSPPVPTPDARPERAAAAPPRDAGQVTERMPWMPTSPATGIVTEPGAAGLTAIREALGDCRRCRLCAERTQIVFGVGDPQARLMFIGEAPGADEDEQGEPFVGRAGQLLTRMISAMGYTREQVYVANVVKCRPPGNRDPEQDEIRECEPFLIRQIDAVQPEVIVTLGRFAFQALTRSKRSIMRSRGTWFEYRGVPAMPTLHPAYLLRNPDAKRDVWADLQQVMARLSPDAGS